MLRGSIVIMLVLLLCQACGDLIENKAWADDPYYVSKTSGAPDGYSLYIRVGSSDGHGRVSGITRVGADAHFVIAESIDADGYHRYWIIDRQRDSPELNAEEIVLGPMDSASFSERLAELNAQRISFKTGFSN